MVKCIDDNIGRLIEDLRQKNLLQNTIIVFTSDHGDLRTEHNRDNKGVPFEASAKVPFIVHYPKKIKQNSVVKNAFSSVDFAPSILGLLNQKIPQQMEGTNMSNLLLHPNDQKNWKDVAYIRSAGTGNQGDWIAAITSRYKLVLSKNDNPWSATADTLFHRVRFGVRKAFFICFEMSTTTRGLSASYTGVRFGITEKTARLFMHKVREAMKSSGNHPMDGTVHIDGFVVGGREQGKVGRSYDGKKKKAVCALQLTDGGKVRRMYSMKIDNFSGKELKKMFDAHIDREAKVTTDIWRGYRPLAKKYDIEQIPGNGGLNFKALHTMIHRIKSWIRTNYPWVSDFNVDRYFDEFCYRLNRSQSKTTIFNNLIVRMVKADKLYQKEIICS